MRCLLSTHHEILGQVDDETASNELLNEVRPLLADLERAASTDMNATLQFVDYPSFEDHRVNEMQRKTIIAFHGVSLINNTQINAEIRNSGFYRIIRWGEDSVSGIIADIGSTIHWLKVLLSLAGGFVFLLAICILMRSCRRFFVVDEEW